ncbi:sigma-54-dependent transcriptional regulator [Vibrio coralliilyticus]|uniref:Sigma-54-dependent Fis family transcriptional regulator n=1 Tax=Vibrio coralliilyticus TaxID=190893 RepID=A0AAP6ZRM6_9VIBR|nr:sigma-54 dependent transcriptional regulator [Vibrio coralliilyticus]NOJ22724.1 sigma-54-dependent Fis family transcriptional regulator [Vibrio coralliilyticus]
MEQVTKHSIALIEDDPIVRQTTAQWLQLAGFDITTFDNGQAALTEITQHKFVAIISDVRLPEINGLELLQQVKQQAPGIPVILITGHGDVDMAVKALQQGAYDFIEKPFEPERLAHTVNQAILPYIESQKWQSRQAYLQRLEGIEQILIGRSQVMCELREQVQKVADIDTNVIIYGDTGCGKELVAYCLHHFSGRQSHPFVPLNCGAIPDNLFESELFGHEAGAYTGAAKRRIGKIEFADKGTLFLDEIESLPLAMQVKLLRALQESTVERVGSNHAKQVNLRVISAAKCDLLNHSDFRPDLFYRLNIAQLHLPALKDREEDALLLFEHFTQEANPNTRRASPADQQALLNYPWPGNVRELRNVAIRFALDDSLTVGDILSCRPQATTAGIKQGLPLAVQMQSFERKILHDALRRHQGCINDVMEELDLPRRTLNQKMVKYALNRSDYIPS